MSLLKEPGITFGNRLLAALPREEYARLSPHLELVRLTPGKILYNAGDVVRHAFFPKAGMICLLSTTESGRTIEVGMIGNEGTSGIAIILRSAVTPCRVMVQLAGNAVRVRGDVLRAEFNRGEGKGGLTQRRKGSKILTVVLCWRSSLRLCASSVRFLPDEDDSASQTEPLPSQHLRSRQVR